MKKSTPFSLCIFSGEIGGGSINGEECTLYYSRPSHKLLALFIMAREIGYKGAYSLQLHIRNTPFIKE